MIINILLEHRTFFKLPLVEGVPKNLLVNFLPKQFLDTKEIVFASETRYVVGF